MTIARNTVFAAFTAAYLAFPAASLAQDHMMADDHMMAAEPMMHPEIGCTAGMSDTGGIMVEFHNMGHDEIPAGTMAHWMVSGVAQGDVNFMDAVAPGGMKSQNYAMMGDDHMMHMPSNAHCSVEAK
jgi:hypothetical protein